MDQNIIYYHMWVEHPQIPAIMVWTEDDSQGFWRTTEAEEFAVAFLAAKSGDAAPVGVDRTVAVTIPWIIASLSGSFG